MRVQNVQKTIFWKKYPTYADCAQEPAVDAQIRGERDNLEDTCYDRGCAPFFFPELSRFGGSRHVLRHVLLVLLSPNPDLEKKQTATCTTGRKILCPQRHTTRIVHSFWKNTKIPRFSGHGAPSFRKRVFAKKRYTFYRRTRPRVGHVLR